MRKGKDARTQEWNPPQSTKVDDEGSVVMLTKNGAIDVSTTTSLYNAGNSAA